MRNYFLTLLVIFFAIGLQAQEGFKLGFHTGLPISDFDEATTLMVALDGGYMYAMGEVVDVGIATGFIHGFAESFSSEAIAADYPNMQFVPLAATVRVWTSNSFSFGLDGGYAVGINEDNEGGLYYKPIIGYLMGSSTEVNFSYTTVKMDEASWNSINLGVLHTFKSKRSR